MKGTGRRLTQKQCEACAPLALGFYRSTLSTKASGMGDYAGGTGGMQ